MANIGPSRHGAEPVLLGSALCDALRLGIPLQVKGLRRTVRMWISVVSMMDFDEVDGDSTFGLLRSGLST